MNIGYCLQGFPVKSQTWIPLEIAELEKRGHHIDVIDIEKQLQPRVIKNCDFIICHFSYQGIHAKRWGIPYGIIPHAYDIWKDDGKALKIATNSKNCKFVGYITDFHKMKYDEWGISKPLYPTPVCCDTEFFKKKKPELGDKIIAGGRNTEKKGLKYAMGFDNIYLYGGKNESLKELNKTVNYLGWIEKKDYRDLMDNSWLYVSPNVLAKNGDMDGQCTTIKEALLMELQVLTTNIAGNREYQHVHFSTAEDISKGISGTEYQNIEKKRNCRGREYVLKTFSPTVCINQYLHAMESEL